MIVLCFLIVIEYLCLPVICTSLKVPEFYKMIAQDKDDYAILQIPQIPPPQFLYYQTIHQKRMYGGYTSRIPESAFMKLKSSPVISDIFLNRYPLMTDGKRIPDLLAQKIVTTVFRINNIRYVILPNNVNNYFLNGYHFNEIYRDEIIRVFQPPQQ